MDSTVPRSTKPVAITVASDQEPVKCDGSLKERADGFTLEFSIRDDKFTIDNYNDRTRLNVCGVMSYDICLGSEDGTTLLSTPYGKIRFDVITVKRDVVRTDSGVRIILQYILKSAEAGEIERAVEITALF